MTTTQHVRLDDHEVKEAILAELAWLPSIQADRIGVAINDGAVTLSGQVQAFTLSGHVASWAERDQAGHAAWATPGVTHVDNFLYIRL